MNHKYPKVLFKPSKAARAIPQLCAAHNRSVDDRADRVRLQPALASLLDIQNPVCLGHGLKW